MRPISRFQIFFKVNRTFLQSTFSTSIAIKSFKSLDKLRWSLARSEIHIAQKYVIHVIFTYDLGRIIVFFIANYKFVWGFSILLQTIFLHTQIPSIHLTGKTFLTSGRYSTPHMVFGFKMSEKKKINRASIKESEEIDQLRKNLTLRLLQTNKDHLSRYICIKILLEPFHVKLPL